MYTDIILFPPSFLFLQQEILKDEGLMAHMALTLQDNAGFEEKVAAIATYLNILVDGMYDPDDICHMLAQKLSEKNTLIITTKQ